MVLATASFSWPNKAVTCTDTSCLLLQYNIPLHGYSSTDSTSLTNPSLDFECAVLEKQSLGGLSPGELTFSRVLSPPCLAPGHAARDS